MSKKLWIFAALALPLYVAAQPALVLLEACNAISDPAKRMECLKAAMGAAGTSAPQAERRQVAVDALKKAFGNMQAGLDIGTSYNNYQVAMLDLAKAVAAFRQDAGEFAAPAMASLNASLEAYRDAAVFWEHSIDFYARRDNSLAYAGGLPVGLTNMEWLVRKYGLPTVRADLLGFHSGLNVTNTRTTLWAYAGSKYNEAFQALTPPAPPAEVDPSLDAPTRSAVELLARAADCKPQSISPADAGTPAVKGWTVRCTSGKSLAIQCESGVCKVSH
ncbi:hypothetical protein [Acidovorax sp.]|uniref:hypothetical protein n=1 Tax=Acidovorax sp. TaxID=1872122 RepID=UPI00391EFE66